MMIELREYQRSARFQINALLNASRHPVFVSPTGTGKTATAVAVIADRISLGRRVYVLTPQSEIFDQWMKELSNAGLNPGYINQEGVRGRGRDVYVCMPLSLVNNLPLLPPGIFPDEIITDECLTGGSRISTSDGLMPIRNVEKGQSVLSSDGEYHRVTRTIKKTAKKLYTIRLTNRSRLMCTGNHLLFTQRGWVKASNMRRLDMVLTIIHNHKHESESRGYGDVRCLRWGGEDRDKVSAVHLSQDRESVLLKRMPSGIQESGFVRSDGPDKPDIRQREDEKSKSYERSCSPSESEHETSSDRTQACNTGRERKRADDSSTGRRDFPWMGNGGSYQNASKTRKRLSSVLQGRCWKQRIEDRRRNRREFSRSTGETSSRQEENGVSEWVGVESVTIQESRDRRGSPPLRSGRFVYDLTVEDTHNYYANGMLVHNCHHSAAHSWEVIYRFFDNATRLGLTATPRRTDGLGLDHLYTDIVQTIEPRQAIDEGYLAKPLLIVPELYHVKVPIRGDDYDPAIQAKMLGEPRIIGDVIAKYRAIFGGHPVLVACSTFGHAKAVTEAFQDAGWKWDHIHSELKTADRRMMLRKIKTGKLHGLCTVGIGIEGMDIPGLYGLIWLRRTLSLTIYLQFIGRVLRPLPGKENGVIVDPVGNLFIHGFPDTPRAWKLTGRPDARRGDVDLNDLELSISICPSCGVMNAGDNTLCHFCGADLSAEGSEGRGARKIPAMVDGKMVIAEAAGGSVDLDARADAAIEELAEKEEEARKDAARLDDIGMDSKGDIIRKNLFSKKSRRTLFNETVERWF